MLTVADVVGEPSLNLTVVTGPDQLMREVRSAHVCELTSPADWLRGGELLMTVGLLLPMRLADCRAYMSECAAAGVAALALGLGHGLPYHDCPEPLMRAAQESGVALLTVPDETPFIAVTKWVFETIAREESRELHTALEINRALTAVATSSAPLAALLGAWSQASDAACIVCDAAGQLVDATPGTAPGSVAAAMAAVGTARASGMAWSVVDGFEIHTVGSRIPLAHIALSAEMDLRSRAASSVLVSLIAVDIERRNLSGQVERQRRSQVFAQLLRPGIKRERAHQMLARVGLGPTPLQVATVAGEDAERLAFRLQAGLGDALVLVRGDTVEIAHADLDMLVETLRAHAEGLPCGIGAPVAAEALSVSAMQARSLLPVSARLGRIVTAGESETVSLLVSLGSPEVVRGFADAVLAPLDALDPRERLELLRTLDQWLRVNGAWDPAAARLSLHRNTVRNRIERIAALTGRRLDDGDERMELWLALKSRAAMS
ncbi:PucR family transcriptional regulator [Mycolicibacterium sphagni]|uniref:CdaR family transcriptional regulator n=1 Tax=Mycolicibacterium sphagni TaxID=1786 RepID=A0A255DNI9_9MYCO|nr:PucR family transcriptional regulator [Mycolicibacterium sphagni]OYN80660.1 CdaR family transcriptional regulator [Mycolicibacterium sphagni]